MEIAATKRELLMTNGQLTIGNEQIYERTAE